MASEKTESTFQDYLQHHLQNLVYGKLPAGYERENKDGTVEVLTNDTWTFAYNKSEVAEMGFSSLWGRRVSFEMLAEQLHDQVGC